MFKKVKFFLVCAGIALGVAGCSNDDGSDPKPVLRSETYDIAIDITDKVGLDHIIVHKSSSTKAVTDVIFQNDTIPVVFDPNAPRPPKTLKWSKSYSKTSAEVISVVIKGGGESVLDTVKLKVTKKDDIVLEKKVSGKDLLLEVGF